MKDVQRKYKFNNIAKLNPHDNNIKHSLSYTLQKYLFMKFTDTIDKKHQFQRKKKLII